MESASNSLPASFFQFPPERRVYPGQLQLMQWLYQLFERGQQSCGIFESPTGTGKSLAIVSAALTWLRDARRALPPPLPTEFNPASADPEEWNDFPGDFGNPQRKRFKRCDHGLVDPSEASASDSGSDVQPNRSNRMAVMECVDAPRVIISSRTHSQLAQLLSTFRQLTIELPCSSVDPPLASTATPNAGSAPNFQQQSSSSSSARAMRRPYVALVASRDRLCVNERVLGSARGGGSIAALCRAAHSTCRYYDIGATKMLAESILRGPLSPCDIEDVIAQGKSVGGCPYYASTRIVARQADVVLLPYNNLVSATGRAAVGWSTLTNKVLIFDEAHNVASFACESGSASVTQRQVDAVQRVVSDLMQQRQDKPRSSSSKGLSKRPVTGSVPSYLKLLQELCTSVSLVVGALLAQNSAFLEARAVGSEPLVDTAGNTHSGAPSQVYSAAVAGASAFPDPAAPIHVHRTLPSVLLNRRTPSRRSVIMHGDSAAGTCNGTVAYKRTFVAHLSVVGFEMALRCPHIDMHDLCRRVRAASISPAFTSVLPCVNAFVDFIEAITAAKDGSDAVVQIEVTVPILRRSSSSGAPHSRSSGSEVRAASDAKVDTPEVQLLVVYISPRQFLLPLLRHPGGPFVAAQLSDRASAKLFGVRALAFVGGTLSPFPDFSASLGLSKPSILTLGTPIELSSPSQPTPSIPDLDNGSNPVIFAASLPHVIDPARASLRVLSSLGSANQLVSMLWTHDRLADVGLLKRLVGAFVAFLLTARKVCKDGIVIFAASYAVLSHLEGPISDAFPESSCYPVFVERRDATEVASVLTAFSVAVAASQHPILLCVMGGRISEGIDLRDGLCRLVVLVGVPYPSPSDALTILRASRRSWGSAPMPPPSTAGSSTVFASSTSALRESLDAGVMRTVNQAIGRALRHSMDYAAILLADARYATNAGLRNLLPSWLRVPNAQGSVGADAFVCATTVDALKWLRNFFASVDVTPSASL